MIGPYIYTFMYSSLLRKLEILRIYSIIPSSNYFDLQFHSTNSLQGWLYTAMDMLTEYDLGDMLVKIALFLLVQALVYCILSNSSNLFSNSPPRSPGNFRPARSVSIRRFLAALSDMPAGGELSPTTPKNQEQSSPVHRNS